MSAAWVVAAKWIAPVEGAVMSSAWMAVEGRQIVDLGEGPPPTDRGEVHDLGCALIIPAFVNAHTHLACQFLKDGPRDLDFPTWLQSGVAPRVIAAARDDEALLRRAASTAVDELLAGGVGTVADGFFHEAGLDALSAKGLRGVFYREYFGAMSDDLEAYAERSVRQVREDAQRLRGNPRLRAGVAPHALYSCPPEVLRAVCATAREEGLRISMHLAESREETEFFASRRGALFSSFAADRPDDRYHFGRSPVQVVADLGILGPDFLAVHAVQLDEADRGLLAHHGVAVAHCPGSNLALDVGVAPVAALESAGVACALGTDSGASCGKLDIFEEMRLSLLAPRARGLENRGDSTEDGATAALRRATWTGARVLGLESEAGSLRPGKAADFAVIRLDRPRHRFFEDPVSALVWAGTPDDVRATVIDGELRYGELAS